MDKNKGIEKLKLLKQKSILQSRKSFWNFCKAINPKFYKDSRYHLKLICDTFQALYEGNLINPHTNKPYKKLQLSCPPGHGKSYTAILFSQWVLGKNIENEIITVSYNEKLSEEFGKGVRDGIEEVKQSEVDINYHDVFPDTKIKYGSAAKSNWSLEGRHHSYLATSFNGTITGMRGNIGIIDDPVKDSYEAFNEGLLKEKYGWYTDTFLSRMVEGAIQICISTRWSTKDLCGMLLKNQPDEWYVLKLKAYDKENDKMLCPELLSKETYLSLKSSQTSEIFEANYNQTPIDIQGKLYQYFKTYTDIPRDEKGNPLFECIKNYTDTADEGSDWLCSICYGVYNKEAYILDILYTQDGMEKTEPATAKMLFNNNVNQADIESNNGGRGFARNVEKHLKEKLKSNKTKISWFHQSKNKKARILSNSTFVMDHIYYPVNWKDKWPEYYEAMNSYQRQGKNAHDDAQDATTGIAENINKGIGTKYDKSVYKKGKGIAKANDPYGRTKSVF